MATNFSPCKGPYVLNQFPSNVMFGMNGFHVSASGAIQGHHGPLVLSLSVRPHKLNVKTLDFPITLKLTYLQGLFGMNAYLINMHLLVPRSRSSAKFKV